MYAVTENKYNASMYLNEREAKVMKVLWYVGSPMPAVRIAQMINEDWTENIHNIIRVLESINCIEVSGRTRICKNMSKLFSPSVTSEEYAVDQFRLYYIRQNGIAGLLENIVAVIRKGKPDILYRLKGLLDSYKYSTAEVKEDSFYFSEKESRVMKALWSSYEPMSAADIACTVGGEWHESAVYRLIKSLTAKNAIAVAGYAQMGKVYGRLFSPSVTCEEYAVSQFSLYYVKENELPSILKNIVCIIGQGRFDLLDKIRDLLEGFS